MSEKSQLTYSYLQRWRFYMCQSVSARKNISTLSGHCNLTLSVNTHGKWEHVSTYELVRIWPGCVSMK